MDYSLIASQYRRRSMSATYNRPSSAGQEAKGLKFGRPYADMNENFFSLPTKSEFAGHAHKPRPTFVHLIHSNSAPVVMADQELGEGTGGLEETQIRSE